jgi:hypothetical protein
MLPHVRQAIAIRVLTQIQVQPHTLAAFARREVATDLNGVVKRCPFISTARENGPCHHGLRRVERGAAAVLVDAHRQLIVLFQQHPVRDRRAPHFTPPLSRMIIAPCAVIVCPT